MNLLVVMEGARRHPIEQSFIDEMGVDKIYLLYLCPRIMAYQYKEQLSSLVNGKIDIEIIECCDFVDFKGIRKDFLDFVACLPKMLKIGKSNLSEYLTVDGFNMWWSSGVVEATPYKHNLIQNLYYLCAIKSILKNIDIGAVWFSLDDACLERDLITMLDGHKMRYQHPPRNRFVNSVNYYSARFKSWLFCFLARLVYFMLFRIITPRWARPRKITNAERHIHLFYSYYPYSLFLNSDPPRAKIYGDLPILLPKKLRGDAYYLCNVSPVYLRHLGKLLMDVRKLWQKRFRFVPMDIYLSLRDILRIFLSPTRYLKYCCLKTSFAYRNIFRICKIDMFHTFDGVMRKSLLEDDAWNNSIHYYAFRRFSRIFGKNISQVIYYVEMHSWEPAVINAIKQGDRSVPVWGLQQSAPNPILLSFYFSPETFKYLDDVYPFPDLMLCASRLYKDLFVSGGISHRRLEVIGHFSGQRLSLLNISDSEKRGMVKASGFCPGKKICLVACCVNFSITESIIYFLVQVARRLPNILFVIKGHPDYSLEPLLSKYNINTIDNIVVTELPVTELLVLSDFFLSASTSVSPEALCLGIPQANLDGWGLPLASPLHLIPDLIRDIRSVEELLDFFSHGEEFRIPKEKCYQFIGGEGVDPYRKFVDVVYDRLRNKKNVDIV